MHKNEVERYSRQMLLPSIGVQGQRTLMASSALIVGGGGLGCPIAMYLAGAGVGKIGCVDGDNVEFSNLHRQIAHDESRVGMNKAESICESIRRYNSLIECKAHTSFLSGENAVDIVKEYDIVLDASDNAPTRYLLNDACIIAKKPLVSGSAIGLEGQITIYGLDGGPCYRCLYPNPPPSSAVGSCSDNGVLGPIPGLIGVMQAIEAIKVLLGISDVLRQKMLIFDAIGPRFREIKLRGRQATCAVCGENPSIRSTNLDYAEFCGTKMPPQSCEIITQWLQEDFQISSTDYAEVCKAKKDHILLDVRVKSQFDICSIPGALNIPLSQLQDPSSWEEVKSKLSIQPIYVVCRRGVDSQKATHFLREKDIFAFNIKGGLRSWASNADSNFPYY